MIGLSCSSAFEERVPEDPLTGRRIAPETAFRQRREVLKFG
jgi:hypothetical protein